MYWEMAYQNVRYAGYGESFHIPKTKEQLIKALCCTLILTFFFI
jgi:hypothetical protein